MSSEPEKQVSVRFKTKLADFRVPEVPLSIPTNVTRLGLSKIVNHLLQLDPPRPFDFLLKDELLRQTLEVALLDKGLSTESVLEIEYVFVTLPPTLSTSVPQQDWISSLTGLSSEAICSGTCDGSLNVFTATGEPVSQCQAHEGGVNAICAWSGTDLLLSAGKDGYACVWRVHDTRLQPLVRLEGHTDAVQAVAVDTRAQCCATSSWDASIQVWDVQSALAEADESAPQKRRKVSQQRAACLSAAHVATVSKCKLEGHNQVVSGLAWPSASRGARLYSGSWDHSLKAWDVARVVSVNTLSTGKAVQCVCTWPSSGDVVACGACDGVLRLWDVRSNSEQLALRGYKSHSGALSSVAWSPASEHILVTASHDKSVRMWDIRTTVPLATLEQHKDKVLAVAWVSGDVVVSGGADSVVHIYSSNKAEE